MALLPEHLIAAIGRLEVAVRECNAPLVESDQLEAWSAYGWAHAELELAILRYRTEGVFCGMDHLPRRA